MAAAEASIIYVHLHSAAEPVIYDGGAWAFEIDPGALRLTQITRGLGDPTRSVYYPAADVRLVETDWAANDPVTRVLTRAEYEAKHGPRDAEGPQ